MALPKGDFTAVQLVATVLAAVTGAVLASSLGVVGTVAGTAIASGASTSATFLYRHYLHRTSERIKAVAPALVQRSLGRGATQEDETPSPPDRKITVGAGEETRRLPAMGRITMATDAPPAEPPQKPRRRLSRRALIAYSGLAVGAFILVMAIVTGVELAAGKPLPSVVWGKSGSGTSIGNTFSRGSSTSTKPSPATTTQPTGGTSAQPTGSSTATAPASQSPSATPSPTAPASPGNTQQSPGSTGPTAGDPSGGAPTGAPAS